MERTLSLHNIYCVYIHARRHIACPCARFGSLGAGYGPSLSPDAYTHLAGLAPGGREGLAPRLCVCNWLCNRMSDIWPWHNPSLKLVKCIVCVSSHSTVLKCHFARCTCVICTPLKLYGAQDV